MKLSVIYLNNEIANIYINSGNYVNVVANEMKSKGFGKVTVTHFDTNLTTRKLEEFITSNLNSHLSRENDSNKVISQDEAIQRMQERQGGETSDYWERRRKVDEQLRMDGHDFVLGNPNQE